MNFEEFILAVGAAPQIAVFNSVDRRELVHRQLWPLLVDFFFVGGMPEAVVEWVESSDNALIERRRSVRRIQRDILNGYERDFGKYSGKINALHIGQVFKNVVSQLQNSIESTTKRYFFKDVIEKKRSYRDFSNVIHWLEKTHLVSKNYMLNSQPRSPIRSYIQNELLSYGLNETYCWSENTAEIEFVLDTPDGIIPIEVKAGKNTLLISLVHRLTRVYCHLLNFKINLSIVIQ